MEALNTQKIGEKHQKDVILNNIFNIAGLAGEILSIFESSELDNETLEIMIKEKLETNNELENNLLSCGRLYKHIEAENKTIDDEIQRLKDRKTRNNNLQERLKGSINFAMQTGGVKSVKDAISTISLRKKPENLEIHNEDLIPEQFRITNLEFNPGALDFEDVDALKEKYGDKIKVSDKISKTTINSWYKETGEVVAGTHAVVNQFTVLIK